MRKPVGLEAFVIRGRMGRAELFKTLLGDLPDLALSSFRRCCACGGVEYCIFGFDRIRDAAGADSTDDRSGAVLDDSKFEIPIRIKFAG